MFNELTFVLRTPFGQRLENRIPYPWLFQFPLGHLEIELSQVPAVQMADQITRTESELTPNDLHLHLALNYLSIRGAMLESDRKSSPAYSRAK